MIIKQRDAPGKIAEVKNLNFYIKIMIYVNTIKMNLVGNVKGKNVIIVGNIFNLNIH
jgi:hypothetical protein